MGANATTTVPTYVNGEVLDAADLNITNSGTPVFATTTTRDAAFGGAGEKTLAEGQLAYIENLDVVQYYTGAAWATVGPTAAGGLSVVKAETAFTTAASITADNVFTSTYTNYRMIMTAVGAAYVNSSLQFRASGVAATTNYNRQSLDTNSTSINAGREASQTSFNFAAITTISCTFVFEFYGPQLAAATNLQSQSLQNVNSAATPQQLISYGNHSTAVAYDGIGITFGTNATGTYTIYGYGKTL